jgi:hypothetical protein
MIIGWSAKPAAHFFLGMPYLSFFSLSFALSSKQELLVLICDPKKHRMVLEEPTF